MLILIHIIISSLANNTKQPGFLGHPIASCKRQPNRQWPVAEGERGLRTVPSGESGVVFAHLRRHATSDTATCKVSRVMGARKRAPGLAWIYAASAPESRSTSALRRSAHPWTICGTCGKCALAAKCAYLNQHMPKCKGFVALL